MKVQILHFEEHPSRSLSLLLFTDVTNSGDLRQQIVTGRFQPEAAVINATLLPSLLVLHASAHKALTAQERGALRARTLHTELVFGLSGSRHVSFVSDARLQSGSGLSVGAALNAMPRGDVRSRRRIATCVQIGETLSRFGIHEGCCNVLVARFDATPEDVARIEAAVAGRQAALSELTSLVDVGALRKQYKVLDEELQVCSLTAAIVSRIAARDCS